MEFRVWFCLLCICMLRLCRALLFLSHRVMYLVCFICLYCAQNTACPTYPTLRRFFVLVPLLFCEPTSLSFSPGLPRYVQTAFHLGYILYWLLLAPSIPFSCFVELLSLLFPSP